ncbi:hypothetical protein ACR75N_04750 [Parabacteroides merdae]|uniref:hypothetical protein n=1 Tax=Parabacteroides merdae TaxID=46503 RepID=UPI003DA6A69E
MSGVKPFSFDTIGDFDNHISCSITGYEVLHSLIVNISSFFIKKGTIPVDLGCTSGKLVKALQEKYGCKAIGFDITGANFLPGLDLRVQDITLPGFEIPRTNLAYSIFTLQFLDVRDRLPLLQRIFDALDKNGALICCEKEVAPNGIIQEVFTFSNYSNKLRQFTPEEILSKEFDLRKIMNCLEPSDNNKLLYDAGFRIVEPFFQSLNFKGYICIK